MTQHINALPEDVLTKILSNLPQKDLVLCREVCQKWRAVIDQHCPMKETIRLEDDKFLTRKQKLRMTSCSLSYFKKTTPRIFLTHPETIKTFAFCDLLFRLEDQDELNVENARRLLFQIAPFVEHLKFAATYFNHNILPGMFPFPKLRELHIGQLKYTMHNNLEILFRHLFPLLGSLYLRLWYSSETLMDETWVNIFHFLADRRQILKRVHIKMNYSDSTFLHGLPESTLEFDLSEKAKGILSKGQLESLELSIPPKYVPTWASIIASQKKLISLTIGIKDTISDWENPVSFQFSGISLGILSNASTLRTVRLHEVSPVTSDGLDWTLLDLSVFRDAANVTELDVRGMNDYKTLTVGTHWPKVNEGPWIINLNEINSTSLKTLRIYGFACNSGELQTVIDNAPVIGTLVLVDVMAPETSERYAESGVHGGIIKSFVEKESKKKIQIQSSLNKLDAAQNEKLNEVRKLYPNWFDSNKSFTRYFW